MLESPEIIGLIKMEIFLLLIFSVSLYWDVIRPYRNGTLYGNRLKYLSAQSLIIYLCYLIVPLMEFDTVKFIVAGYFIGYGIQFFKVLALVEKYKNDNNKNEELVKRLDWMKSDL